MTFLDNNLDLDSKDIKPKHSSASKAKKKKQSPNRGTKAMNANNSMTYRRTNYFMQTFKHDPPMNLMQFKGVRVSPDKKVLDFLNILNNYRKQCESKGLHLEAKKARRRYDIIHFSNF